MVVVMLIMVSISSMKNSTVQQMKQKNRREKVVNQLVSQKYQAGDYDNFKTIESILLC